MDEKIINIEVPAGKKVMLSISICTQEIPVINDDALTMSLDNILTHISNSTNIAKELIISRSRKQMIVAARMCFIHIATEQGYTSVKIGKYLGRDHSTVLNGLQKYTQLLKYKDHLLLKIISQIELIN
jgi:chromosomal replication initiation ATPase DnaA